MKYLIINADDFGLSPSVNRGILEMFLRGNITSASLMVNMPGFEDAVQIARQYPALSVGLHFNLTYGQPVSKDHVSSLIDDHSSFSSGQTWKPRHIRHELYAQWHRFRKTGLRPTHIDSHQLIQCYPNVYPCIAEFAMNRYVPLRRTVPMPHADLHPVSTDFLISDTYDEADAGSKVERVFENLQVGVTELYCHPGYVDEYVHRYSSWTTKRELELETFKGLDIPSMCLKYGVTPISYRDFANMRS